MALKLDLGHTYGVAYISISVSAMLYGASLLQGFIYFMHSRGDPKWIKAMVIFVLNVETVHQALLIHAGYYYLIENYANPLALGYGVWSIISSVFCNAVVAFVSELFMVFRVYRMSGNNKAICIPLAIVTVAHLGTNFVWPIQALGSPSLTNVIHLSSTALPTLAIGAVIDTLIAGFLAWFIWKRRTGFQRSDSMVTKLVLYIITSSALTSMNSIANLITYAATPDKFYFMLFNFLVCKLYTNCLLSSLNSRSYIRGTADIELSTSAYFQTGSSLVRNQSSGLGRLGDAFGDGRVHIHVQSSKVTTSGGQWEDALNPSTMMKPNSTSDPVGRPMDRNIGSYA